MKPFPWEKFKVGKCYRALCGNVYRCLRVAATKGEGHFLVRDEETFKFVKPEHKADVLARRHHFRGPYLCGIASQTHMDRYTIIEEIGSRPSLKKIGKTRGNKSYALGRIK